MVLPPLPGRGRRGVRVEGDDLDHVGVHPEDVSATIAWNPPATPDMSATPVRTCTLPSGETRHAAAAAFVAPGQ